MAQKTYVISYHAHSCSQMPHTPRMKEYTSLGRSRVEMEPWGELYAVHQLLHCMEEFLYEYQKARSVKNAACFRAQHQKETHSTLR